MRILTTTVLSVFVFLIVPDAQAQFSQTDYPAGDGPFAPIFADLDGDENQDLAVTNTNSGNVTVLMNTSGGFSAVSGSHFGVGSEPVDLAAADFDGGRLRRLLKLYGVNQRRRSQPLRNRSG